MINISVNNKTSFILKIAEILSMATLPVLICEITSKTRLFRPRPFQCPGLIAVKIYYFHEYLDFSLLKLTLLAFCCDTVTVCVAIFVVMAMQRYWWLYLELNISKQLNNDAPYCILAARFLTVL